MHTQKIGYTPEVSTFLEIAEHEIGVTEEGGNNTGRRVEEYQMAVDGVATRESWCMAFVQWCVAQAEDKLHMVTEIFRGEHCLTVWNRTPDTMKGQTPIAGAIVIWRKIGTAQGHCGIVEGLEASGKYLRTIEGNTGVLGARESRDGGDGVCRKVRPLRGFGEMTTVGFLYPFAPGPIRLRARMPPTDKAPPTV